MPIVDTGNGTLHYQIEGDSEAPVLVLSNSLGTTLDMWSPQMPALLEHFRVLRYDTRGHGQSEVTLGPYTTRYRCCFAARSFENHAGTFLWSLHGWYDRDVARHSCIRSDR
jgi:pimeloyl-ACP methyl ester carboxylesterase